MRRLARLSLVASLSVVVLGGLAPTAQAAPDPWELIGGSPPIWDRCGMPLSNC